MIELFPLQVYPLTLILFISGNLAADDLLYSRLFINVLSKNAKKTDLALRSSFKLSHVSTSKFGRTH